MSGMSAIVSLIVPGADAPGVNQRMLLRVLAPIDFQGATIRLRRSMEATAPFCPCGCSLDLSQPNEDDPDCLIGYCLFCDRLYLLYESENDEFIDFFDLTDIEEQARRFIEETNIEKQACLLIDEMEMPQSVAPD